MSIPGMPSSVPSGGDYGWISDELRSLWSAIRELGPSVADSVKPLVDELAQRQADLEEQQAYLSSLITRDAVLPSFNTGTLANDATWHLIGSQMVIANMPIATGKVRITVSSSEASISPGTNSVNAGITWSIDGISTLDMAARSARSYSAGAVVGSPLMRIDPVTIPPGTYTIRAQAGYWSFGTSTASIQFSSLRLLAEVVGAG